jgi:phage shock protein C
VPRFAASVSAIATRRGASPGVAFAGEPTGADDDGDDDDPRPSIRTLCASSEGAHASSHDAGRAGSPLLQFTHRPLRRHAMGITDDLERLTALHRSGALTDAEFSSAKARALGAATRASSDGIVHWLHALRRSRSDRWIGGVCGGLAPATGLPSWAWRLSFVALSLCGGTGLMLYLLYWILVPKEEVPLDIGTASVPST